MSSGFARALAGALVTATIFATVIAAPLSFDDRFIVLHHPVVNGTLTPLAAFDHGWWQGVAEARGNEYRPLSTLALALEVGAFGAVPWRLRFLGLLLHLGICVAVFGLARRLGVSRVGAELAACLFALHPIHLEVVNRKSVV